MGEKKDIETTCKKKRKKKEGKPVRNIASKSRGHLEDKTGKGIGKAAQQKNVLFDRNSFRREAQKGDSPMEKLKSFLNEIPLCKDNRVSLARRRGGTVDEKKKSVGICER